MTTKIKLRKVDNGYIAVIGTKEYVYHEEADMIDEVFTEIGHRLREDGEVEFTIKMGDED